MKSFVVLCLVSVVCSAFGFPEAENHALLIRSRRDTVFIENTGKLIQELVQNLINSANEAKDAVTIFNAGIRDEVEGVRDKIRTDLLKFRLRVTDAVDNVMQRISNSSTAVKECVSTHRTAAAAVFDNTMSETMACVDERMADVSGRIQDLMTMANDAMASGSQALDDMKKCTTDTTNILSTGTCLVRLAVQTETMFVTVMGKFAVTMGRINIDIATLPASLEVCAGKQLIQTGIETGKIVLRIGTCSTTGVFNSIIGKPNVE